jgi:hypothetical protein
LLKPPGLHLGVPGKRSIPEHIGKPQLLRLPSIEDRFHDVRRQAGERQEPADVSVRDALLLRKVGDRLRLTPLDSAPPAMRSIQRLDQGLVWDDTMVARRSANPNGGNSVAGVPRRSVAGPRPPDLALARIGDWPQIGVPRPMLFQLMPGRSRESRGAVAVGGYEEDDLLQSP